MQIYVLANQHREPLITKYLSCYSHQVYVNPDSPYGGIKPFSWLNENDIGSQRCFSGHKAIWEKIAKESGPCLVLEDDASRLFSNWYELVEHSSQLLPAYQVVSLHGSHPEASINKPFKHGNYDYVTLKRTETERDRFKGNKFTGCWGLSSLAYLISPEAAKLFSTYEYDGMPSDLFLSNRSNYCCIRLSPFVHNRIGGSLVESAV